jgi:hypothetical protein
MTRILAVLLSPLWRIAARIADDASCTPQPGNDSGSLRAVAAVVLTVLFAAALVGGCLLGVMR